jgi:hypothetical protein
MNFESKGGSLPSEGLPKPFQPFTYDNFPQMRPS